ncbi:hypothetical protein KO02_22020 [Sphingobacterium sp. ML3W]|uniref:hypothetical protein n=1 Tax=Sphingobacterium sp. ML3W TaxID=1538644 RepID=UPI0004F6D8A0|nr:hypothetical protein [Sphingobacterium sp. ML3W]AIM39062.1 hypothetical protein KO02_22020 [Sphingobacterium sp. ML3W]
METNSIRPLGRHPSLQPLSREHHFSLLLCWKIRKGLEQAIEVKRLQDYIIYLWENQIAEHFDIEERLILPILGEEHVGVIRARKEHRLLRRLFLTPVYTYKTINRIEETLEKHIRFEERELFPLVQETASLEDWQKLESVHNDDVVEIIWKDEFWK